MSEKKDVDATKVAETLVKDEKPRIVFTSQWYCGYPPSQTEQIHSASLSELVRAGQGTAIEPENDKDMYDFPDGRDDGSQPVGVFEFSEPAETFEREAAFKDALSRDLNKAVEARKRVESEKSNKTSTSTNNASQNQSSGVSADFKGNDGTSVADK